jgi:hypothetical protein
MAASVASLALGLCACPVIDPTDSSPSQGGGSDAGGGSLSDKCSGCPRQAPELGGLCLSISAVCGYQGQSAVRECMDRGVGAGIWEESPMTPERAKAIDSCPDAKPSAGSACQSSANVCVACYYSNGCEKPTTTMLCDPASLTWVPSPMDATNPQITYCTPGSDAGGPDASWPDAGGRKDSGLPDTKPADTALDPNPCIVSGSLPSCVCTYPDGYVGYTICGYGSYLDPDRYYIWPKSDSRYWGNDVTCAPTSLCQSARRCDFDPDKLCCSPNNADVWNIECKFDDPSALERRKSCCR